MEKQIKIHETYAKTQKALAALGKAIELATSTDLPLDVHQGMIDSCIQRFEFSLELMVRLLQRILEAKLEYPVGTRAILQSAYKCHLINNEKNWINMWEDRNLTVHTYNESFATELYTKIQSDYFPELSAVLAGLAAELASNAV